MHTAEEMEAKKHIGSPFLLNCGRLGAIGLSSTSRYLARGREVQHTQFVRPMVTKVLVATNVATSWDCILISCITMATINSIRVMAGSY